jgi:hypothetical protein
MPQFLTCRINTITNYIVVSDASTSVTGDSRERLQIVVILNFHVASLKSDDFSFAYSGFKTFWLQVCVCVCVILNEGKSAASFCHPMAVLVPDMFWNFF